MPSTTSSSLTLLSRGTPDVYAEVDRADRAEAKAEKLMQKLDAERALTTSLKGQLRTTTMSMQQAAQQARALHGAPGAAHAAAGGSSSLVGLQRQVASLRDRLDVERKEKNSFQSQATQLSTQLGAAAKERQSLVVLRDQQQRELHRETDELERARRLLRESGTAHDDAIAELCSLTMTHGKDKAQGAV